MAPNFAASRRKASNKATSSQGAGSTGNHRPKKGRQGANKREEADFSLEQFVARTIPLLDLESEAEVTQVSVRKNIAGALQFHVTIHAKCMLGSCERGIQTSPCECVCYDMWFMLQAQEELAGGQMERAASRGRVLLNLRCTAAEGGLLGRTLLTLVSNKVQSLQEAVC